jgi:DNA-binding XRE family transcriptional regulator
MKNFDLIWAREWAGLTQAQAAETMGVHRVTFAQWETGARAIPTRKWQRFVELMKINPRDIPTRPEPLIYDAKGYPVGFTAEFFDEMAKDIATFIDSDGDETYDQNFGYELEEVELSRLEGNDYEVRARERYWLMIQKPFRNPVNLPGGVTFEEKAAQVRAEWEYDFAPGQKELTQEAASEWRRWKLTGSEEALSQASAAWRRWAISEYKGKGIGKIIFAHR